MTNELPDPSELAELAENEPSRRVLQRYSRTIAILREEKLFTFREIAKWLCEHGVVADHNTVFRHYTKHADKAQTLDEELSDERLETEDDKEEACKQ
jgi:hypothetical protein